METELRKESQNVLESHKQSCCPQTEGSTRCSRKSEAYSMKLVRIQLELPEDKAEEIEGLMKEIGVQTKKELFNGALTLLKWAVRETKRGNSIASVDEAHGKYRE